MHHQEKDNDTNGFDLDTDYGDGEDEDPPLLNFRHKSVL